MSTTTRPGLRVTPRPLGILAASLLVVVASYIVSSGTRPPAIAPAAIPSHSASAPDLPPPNPPATGASGLVLTRFDRAIAAWRTNVAANPHDYLSATNLGTTFVGRARLTGDLKDYQRALWAADRAIEIDSTFVAAHILRSSILMAVHDFRGAIAEARAIRRLDRGNLEALATIGDATLELGKIDEARSAYAQLERRAPTAPVLSRLAHLAFITGERDRAIKLARQAVESVSGEPASQTTAFYSFQLGELYRAAGDVHSAEAAYARALADAPTYAAALEGLARVREAQGRRDEAIALLEQVAGAQLPDPELLATIGDLYALSGDQRAAERLYIRIERMAGAGGRFSYVYDRQLVLFAADHERDLADALSRARADLRRRHDVYAHDALGWVLFKAGRLDEAARQAQAALSLGTRDPRLDYHAGMIAAAQRRTSDARRLLTLAVDGEAFLAPLQVPLAEAALAGLSPSGS